MNPAFALLLAFTLLVSVGCGAGDDSSEIAQDDSWLSTPTPRPTATPRPTVTPTPAPTITPIPMPDLVKTLSDAPSPEGDIRFHGLRDTMAMMKVEELDGYTELVYGKEVSGWTGKVIELKTLETGESALVLEVQEGDHRRPYFLVINLAPSAVETIAPDDIVVIKGNIKKIGEYADMPKTITIACSEIYKK